MKRIVALTVAAGVLSTATLIPSASAQDSAKTQVAKVEDQAARIKWWREASFGMFIHWGLYSIPGRGEWVQWNEQIPVNEYAKLADQFNPRALIRIPGQRWPSPPA